MVTLAEELPFAAAIADENLARTCSACFSSKGSKSRCIGCKIVSYCDKDCQKKDWVDHKNECSFLNNCSPNIPPAICRLMARIAMKLRRPDGKKPAFNGRVFEDLMDHCNEIKKDAERMKAFAHYSRILRLYMGDKIPDSDLLLSIFGKVEINSFGVSDENSQCGHGLYLGLSAHDHSCVPNVHIINDRSKAILRSADPDKKYSKALTITYTEPLFVNRDRQQQLRASYYFTCTCARCSDPTLDFLYNSARSSCCADSYCLLDPDFKEMTCNKCGTVSGITVKEAIAANEEVKMFSDKDHRRTRLGPGSTYNVPTLIEASEKFSKILSPLNLNLLMLKDRLLRDVFKLNQKNPMCRKYAEEMLPVYRRYLNVGDQRLSEHLLLLALTRSFERPPTKKVLEPIQEALAAFLVSHGPEHSRIVFLRRVLSVYQNRLQLYARQGIDTFDYL